jgi:hypothetical protein
VRLPITAVGGLEIKVKPGRRVSPGGAHFSAGARSHAAGRGSLQGTTLFTRSLRPCCGEVGQCRASVGGCHRHRAEAVPPPGTSARSRLGARRQPFPRAGAPRSPTHRARARHPPCRGPGITAAAALSGWLRRRPLRGRHAVGRQWSTVVARL